MHNVDTDTHSKTCSCGNIVTEDCAGGNASCVNKPVCVNCYAEYGSINQNAHEFGDWIEEVPATCISTGTVAHKECNLCHKNFDSSGVQIDDLTIDINQNAHTTPTNFVYADLGYGNHKKLYACCNAIIVESETHDITHITNSDGTHKKAYNCCEALTVLAENCSGGTATFSEKAICEHCNTQYGEEKCPVIFDLYGNVNGLEDGYDLSTLTIPASEGNTINANALKDVTFIQKIVLPVNITVIESNAFSGCISLKNINLNNVITIKANAFDGCAVLNTVSLANIEKIYLGAFSNTGLATVTEVTDYAHWLDDDSKQYLGLTEDTFVSQVKVNNTKTWSFVGEDSAHTTYAHYTFITNGDGTHQKYYTCCNESIDIAEPCTGSDATFTSGKICQYCEDEYTLPLCPATYDAEGKVNGLAEGFNLTTLTIPATENAVIGANAFKNNNLIERVILPTQALQLLRLAHLKAVLRLRK